MFFVDWKQYKKSSSIEKAHASFVEVNTNGMSQDLLRIDLVKSHISYIRKRKDPSSSKLIFDKRPDHTNINPFYSISSKVVIQQSLNQNQVTTRTLLKMNKKCQSFIILSSIDILESPCKYAIKMLIVRVLFSFALCKTHQTQKTILHCDSGHVGGCVDREE